MNGAGAGVAVRRPTRLCVTSQRSHAICMSTQLVTDALTMALRASASETAVNGWSDETGQPFHFLLSTCASETKTPPEGGAFNRHGGRREAKAQLPVCSLVARPRRMIALPQQAPLVST
jgi:hypothetical protein